MSVVNFLGALQKRADLDLDQFADHWMTTHRGLMLPLAAQGWLAGYVQNLKLADKIEGMQADLDGVPSFGFATRPHYR